MDRFFLLLSWLAYASISLVRGADSPSGGYPPALVITMPVDHFNSSDTRTFENRFWVNSTWYQKGGPVFMYDNGEAGITDGEAYGILGGTQELFNVVELARKYRGIAIVWEHRFYGGSLPFPVDNTTGFPLAGEAAFKYLNNDQALEDVAYFARNLKLPGITADLTSKSTPWIWVGGSYAGTRAAMGRIKFPETFLASWSSSAPVESIVGSSVYFNPILEVMPKNCTADMNAAIDYADQTLSKGNSSQVALIRKALFLANSANPQANTTYPIFKSPEDISHWYLGQLLSYPFQGSFVAFQSFGYTQSMGSFCNRMERWDPSNATKFTMDSPTSVLTENSDDANITVAGVAATHGAEAAFYAYLYAIVQKGIADYDFFPGAFRSSIDNASWFWQLCTQFGQWQLAAPPHHIKLISGFLNLTSTEQHNCYQPYPYAPKYPDRVILKYGGWHMRPSNVMFSNGADDPWRTLSVGATTQINPAAPNRPMTTVVPKCNTPPLGDSVFGQIYPNAVHGQDIAQSLSVPANVTTPYTLGMALFEKALDEWLPCFGKT